MGKEDELRAGSFLTLTSQLVYLNGTASLSDLSGLICGDKGRIFLRRCYFNTRIHTRTHTEVS